MAETWHQNFQISIRVKFSLRGQASGRSSRSKGDNSATESPNRNQVEVQPPRPRLRKVKPEYVRNGHGDVLYFTHATHMPSDVFAYGREAPNCFDERRYLATII